MNHLIFNRELTLLKPVIFTSIIAGMFLFRIILPIFEYGYVFEGITALVYSIALACFLGLSQGLKQPEFCEDFLKVLPLSRTSLIFSRWVPLLMSLFLILFVTHFLLIQTIPSTWLMIYSLFAGLGALGIVKLCLRFGWGPLTVFLTTLLIMGSGFIISHQMIFGSIEHFMFYRGLERFAKVEGNILWLSYCLIFFSLGMVKELKRPGPMR